MTFLKVSSKFAKMIAGYFKSAYEILDKYELTAPGLVAIKDYCVEMINNDSLNEVVEIATLSRCIRRRSMSLR